MAWKTFGQIAGITSAVAGAGTATYKVTTDVVNSTLVTRREYEAAIAERKAAERAHSYQLAGWQDTLNDVKASNEDVSRKVDQMLLMLAGRAVLK